MENELVKVEGLKAVEVFTVEGIEPILQEIRSKVVDAPKDVSTPVQRQKIKSLANKVARSKTLLDSMGKDLVSQWKAQSKKVDESRKKLRDELDALKADVRKPLTEWEEHEKAKQRRVVQIVAYLNSLLVTDTTHIPLEKVESTLEEVSKIKLDEFFKDFPEGECAPELIRQAIERLKNVVENKKKQAIEQAELEKLRKEKAEREAKEREERMRQEAKQEAEKEAQAKIQRAKLEAEQAKERSIRAEEKRKFEAEQQKKRIEEAKKRAAEQERLRIEREEEAARKVQEKREANKKHRMTVELSVSKAISAELDWLDEESATAAGVEIAKAIRDGKIQHVTINY